MRYGRWTTTEGLDCWECGTGNNEGAEKVEEKYVENESEDDEGRKRKKEMNKEDEKGEKQG